MREKQVIIGLVAEGTTDNRFLEHIVERTFEQVALENDMQIVVLPIQILEKSSGSFTEMVMSSAKKAYESGIMVLCVHTDADEANDNRAFDSKIHPAIVALEKEGDEYCKLLVPIIPIHETEAWMLADKDLLKEHLGTEKTDTELAIHRHPEYYTDPKQIIVDAIRIAVADWPPKRRHTLNINDLYTPMGQQSKLELLERLPSYHRFKEAVHEAYQTLGYMR